MSTTSNSMNFLAQKNDAHLSLKIPRVMRDLIHEQAQLKNMSDSNYVKTVLVERLEVDFTK
jgi:hypothetical protein